MGGIEAGTTVWVEPTLEYHATFTIRERSSLTRFRECRGCISTIADLHSKSARANRKTHDGGPPDILGKSVFFLAIIFSGIRI